MTEENNIKTFDDISEEFRTYIVKYISTKFNAPIYIVWYTDTDKEETDKFLTFKTKTIFAATNINYILEAIAENMHSLIYSERLQMWLNNGARLTPIENCVFDIDQLEKDICNNNLSKETLGNFVDFINIAGDFNAQNDNILQEFVKTELIFKVWEFSYDEYFWTKPENSVNQELKVDHLKLLNDFQKLRTKFESYFELHEQHSH